MMSWQLPAVELTEAETALFGLVAALEQDDYRTCLGMPATSTRAFTDAKTLVELLVLLSRPPGPPH